MVRDIFGGYFSPISAALLILLTLLAIGLVLLAGFTLVNSAGINPTKTAITIVESKQFVPSSTMPIVVGKLIFMQCNPESYQLSFKIGETKTSQSVVKKFFNEVSVGDRIKVEYGFGRFTKFPQATKIELVGQ